jgi:predicted AAA+ superfamily ATPase
MLSKVDEVFRRPQAAILERRLAEPRRFVQVVAGPRQVGKTTLVRQVMERYERPARYASADEPTLRDSAWIVQQWDAARLKAGTTDALLVLDEIQKVQAWSETVKRLWDEDTRARIPLKVVLLGSAPLLIQRGLSESLAGRFEILQLGHWSAGEMREAFGWPVERSIFYGGYPGAAALADDHERWTRYVRDALIETTLSRDVLLLTRVDKPALLRRLFDLGCRYSGQILSYNKMLGQLRDAGNTTTLAHYLDLLASAGMVCGLPKFSGEAARSRASSPKLQVLNNALMTALSGFTYEAARADREYWGRLVESAVGAYLANAAAAGLCELYYWRDGNREVDFVLRFQRELTAIEVKSGRLTGSLPGMEAFASAFKPKRCLLIGGDGIPIDEFLTTPLESWLRMPDGTKIGKRKPAASTRPTAASGS